MQKLFQIFNRLLTYIAGKKINYPSKIDDSKTFEKNNPTIAFNMLFTNE